MCVRSLSHSILKKFQPFLFPSSNTQNFTEGWKKWDFSLFHSWRLEGSRFCDVAFTQRSLECNKMSGIMYTAEFTHYARRLKTKLPHVHFNHIYSWAHISHPRACLNTLPSERANVAMFMTNLQNFWQLSSSRVHGSVCRVESLNVSADIRLVVCIRTLTTRSFCQKNKKPNDDFSKERGLERLMCARRCLFINNHIFHPIFNHTFSYSVKSSIHTSLELKTP